MASLPILGAMNDQKEHDIISTYEQFVLEFRPVVQDVLIKAVANDFHKNVLKTWRRLRITHGLFLAACIPKRVSKFTCDIIPLTIVTTNSNLKSLKNW